MKQDIEKDPEERRYPIEAISLLGQLPSGWDNPEIRRRDEESLRGYGIRVMTYDELINRAHSAYAKLSKLRSRSVSCARPSRLSARTGLPQTRLCFRRGGTTHAGLWREDKTTCS